jgi:hypothetical protein
MPLIGHSQEILKSKDLSFWSNSQLLVAILETLESGRPVFGR